MTDLPRPTLIGRTIALTIAAAATLVIVAGSAAPAAASPATVVIDLAGIDLASPAGEARIAAAVARAAGLVCSGGDRGLAGLRARRACIDTALGGAMPQLTARADAARNPRTALAGANEPTNTVRR